MASLISRDFSFLANTVGFRSSGHQSNGNLTPMELTFGAQTSLLFYILAITDFENSGWKLLVPSNSIQLSLTVLFQWRSYQIFTFIPLLTLPHRRRQKPETKKTRRQQSQKTTNIRKENMKRTKHKSRVR